MPTSGVRGVLLVLAAAMLWGTTGTAQSMALGGLAPVWVGTGRLIVGALFLAALIALTQRSALRRNQLGQLPWRGIGLAALCMTVYNLAFFAGVRLSGVAVGTAIAIGSGPVWAGLLPLLFGGAVPARSWWTGTIIAVSGGALMVLAPGESTAARIDPVGIGLCLLTGLSYAVYALLNQRLVVNAAPRGATAVITAAIFVGAALFALPISTALTGPMPSLAGLSTTEFMRGAAVLLWLGVAATGLAYLCFSHALRYISAATGVSLALAEPVMAFALAVIVVGERPGLWAFVGLLAVLSGLLMVVRAETGALRNRL